MSPIIEADSLYHRLQVMYLQNIIKSEVVERVKLQYDAQLKFNKSQMDEYVKARFRIGINAKSAHQDHLSTKEMPRSNRHPCEIP